MFDLGEIVGLFEGILVVNGIGIYVDCCIVVVVGGL